MNAFTRREFLKSSFAGLLVVHFSLDSMAATGTVLAPPKNVDRADLDAWLSIDKSGKVTVYAGKVDLGTGVKTALAQIVADELYVPFKDIQMIMGDTATTPDQWITGGALSIMQGGSELRVAAANARETLLLKGAEVLKKSSSEVLLKDSFVISKNDPNVKVSYADLIGNGFQVKVDPKIKLKNHQDYSIVGKSIPRVDIPQKVTGEFPYMHDFKLPGMVHARVIRSNSINAKIESFDDSDAKKINGFLQTVRKNNFIAVVASSEWAAVKASRAVKINWSNGPDLPAKATVYDHWRKLPLAKEEVTQKAGDVQTAISKSSKKLKATYNFAVQTHASIGPSCAVVDYKDGKLTAWSASQATHSMQHELSVITGLPKESIRLLYLDGSGCYGRNGHEDATADAALIAMAIGKPVRLQWMRHDETALAPKSPPRTMDLEASLDDNGKLNAWKSDFYIASNEVAFMKPLNFPLLAANDTGVPRPGNWVGFLFQNSASPYEVPNALVNTKHVAQTFLRSSHLRSPGRIENSFANESFIDEMAHLANADPAEFRLKHLSDPRAIHVMRAVMNLSKWDTTAKNTKKTNNSSIAKGRGISYVRYNNSITYVATVADVEVNKKTGKVRVTDLYIAHDCGQMINPDGVLNQLQGGAIQTVSRVLMEEVKWTGSQINSVDWATYPILRFNEVPKIHATLINQPGTPAWGAGEQTPTTIPAAVANAIFDAIGVRMRTVPFTPESVKLAIKEQLGKSV